MVERLFRMSIKILAWWQKPLNRREPLRNRHFILV
jgi:hypothetical protein